MLRTCSLVFLVGTLLGVSHLASAQQIHIPPSIAQSQGMGDVPMTSGDDIQKKQAIAASLQRQVQMRQDSEKLSQLTQELNAYLQKTDGVMSIDALKKAEQIEKLAKSVRSKLKQSF